MPPLTIPLSEASALGDARHEVERWLAILRPIAQEILDGAPKTDTLMRHALNRTIPFPTLRSKWYAWVKFGPKGLVNQAKYPLDRQVGLPKAFIDWVKALHELHSRGQTGREVHRKIIKQWQAWRNGDGTKAIPGYSVPPEPERDTGVPAGWSRGNLLRDKFKPDKYEITVRRIGTGAARELLPTVPRTRVGLEFGQLIQIDDQDYDVLIHLEGIMRQAIRPAGFNAFEGLSGSHFEYCFKPTFIDEASGSKKRLTEQDCLWFVIHFLTKHGYRADVGTTIFAEKGTAAIRAALAQGLGTVSHGKVTVQTGGMTGNPLLHDMGFPVTSTTKGTRHMAGRPKGNFKFKADIEGSFALVRTLMAHLRGPTGTRLAAPEENYALEIYNANILKWAEKLPAARAAQLVKPVMGWQEFGELTAWIYHQMDSRTWHELEGWPQCGFMEHVVRIDPAGDEVITYEQIMQIPDERRREAFLTLLTTPGYGELRRLSPRDVFRSQAHLLTKVSRHHWNLCVPNEYAQIVKVQSNHTIKVKNPAPGGKDLVYLARATTERGLSVNLSAGETVRVYANPFCPEEALACNESDQVIGLVPQMMAVSKLDREGALRVHGSIQQMRTEMEIETRARAQATVGEERAMMVQHNAEVIAGNPVTPEERKEARRRKRNAPNVEAMLSGDVEPECIDVDQPSNPEAWL